MIATIAGKRAANLDLDSRPRQGLWIGPETAGEQDRAEHNSHDADQERTKLASGPDMTLRGLAAELAEPGVKVSYRTVWNFVHREKIGYKKSVFPAEQNRPRVARHRARRKRYPDKIDPQRLVFIDETWVILRQAQDQYGAAPWRVRARQAPRRGRSLRPREDVDLCGRAALRRDRSAMRL
jgi:hypothetical protein